MPTQVRASREAHVGTLTNRVWRAMAIDPPSDIVLDVARAADPERAAAVARRLTNLAAGTGGADADFAAALSQTGPAPPTSSPAVGTPNMRAQLANAAQASDDKTNQARV